MLITCLFVASFAGAAIDSAVRSLIDAGHWKQARAILEPRVKANPNDAEAAAQLSRVRYQYGDFDGALALAQTAVRIEPGMADYHWQLAQVLGEMAQRASVSKQFGLGRRFKQEAEAAMARTRWLTRSPGSIPRPAISRGRKSCWRRRPTAISRTSTGKPSAPRTRRP